MKRSSNEDIKQKAKDVLDFAQKNPVEWRKIVSEIEEENGKTK